MPFTTSAQDKIRDDILRDIKNQTPDADTGIDSDNSVRASAEGSAVEGLYQHQQWIARQIFPDTADLDMLEKHVSTHGLAPRKSATYASGSATFTGTPGAEVPVGTQAKDLSGKVYATTVSALVGVGGAVDVAMQAAAAGVAGNLAPGTILTLVSPPSGVGSSCTVVSMLGGVDQEGPSEMLARLLDHLRNPPAGGNAADYRRWAMEVPGVTAAYVYPLRRGSGRVDVVITSGGGLPSTALLDEVTAYIDAHRPAGMKDFLVLAPTEVVVNLDIQVKLQGITLTQADGLIQSAEASYFSGLAPGDTAVKSYIEAIVSNTSGVVDRVVAAPASNVVPVVDSTKVEWVRLGTVTVSLMP